MQHIRGPGDEHITNHSMDEEAASTQQDTLEHKFSSTMRLSPEQVGQSSAQEPPWAGT